MCVFHNWVLRSDWKTLLAIATAEVLVRLGFSSAPGTQVQRC